MDFLNKIVWGNTVLNYLIVFGIITISVMLKKYVSQYIASFIFKVLARRWKFLNKAEFTALVLKPLSWFIVLLIAVLVLDKLNFPSALNFKIRSFTFQEIIDKVGTALIIISFFNVLVNGLNFIALVLEKSSEGPNDKTHDQVVVFFRDLLKIVISIIGVLVLLKVVFHQNIGAMLTGLGIVGAALALAAKESLENLIASFIIFLDKPFFTGDTLKVNNVTGTVERIGLRSTRIRTPDRTLVTVPNKQMVDSVVDNMSMRNLRRAEIKLNFSEKSNPQNIEKFIADTKKILEAKQTQISKYTVSFTEYNKDGVTILVEYFTLPFARVEFDVVKQEINLSLMQLVQQSGLELNSGGNEINILGADGSIVPPKNNNLL
jgi:MscS family membrane protein